MRVALVNPTWSFTDSIYFGCREPHLPLELGCSKALLEAAGYEAVLFDGNLDGQDLEALADAVAAARPDMTVVTTAPTYLFWRCAQPELTVPRAFLDRLGARGGRTVAVGPHGSTTPETTLRKLGCDVVVRGECEEVLVELAAAERPEHVRSVAFRRSEGTAVTGPPAAARFTDLPALEWPDRWVRRHHHHHHRFDHHDGGPGAEVEASRGCPYACSFCAKLDFRDAYRKRDLGLLMAEIDRLIGQGARYLYFIDEIFLPNRPLLEALVEREVAFGIQTRIDLWKPEMLDLLGRAGCVSVEAGVESLTVEGREELNKRCRMTTEELAERLVYARGRVPFVQANLIGHADDPGLVAYWRDSLRAAGVWANDPVPLFLYPASPHYHRLFGEPDDRAWERAHEHYLAQFDRFSDLQEARPRPLPALERALA